MNGQDGIEHVIVVHFKLTLSGTTLKIGTQIVILLLLLQLQLSRKRGIDIAVLVAGVEINRDESEDSNSDQTKLHMFRRESHLDSSVVV